MTGMNEGPDLGRRIERMAGFETTHAFGGFGAELFVMDRCTSARDDDVQRSPFSE